MSPVTYILRSGLGNNKPKAERGSADATRGSLVLANAAAPTHGPRNHRTTSYKFHATSPDSMSDAEGGLGFVFDENEVRNIKKRLGRVTFERMPVCFLCLTIKDVISS